MKTVALLYDTSCIYEIVILNYFLKVTGKKCSLYLWTEKKSPPRKDTG